MMSLWLGSALTDLAGRVSSSDDGLMSTETSFDPSSVDM